MKTLIVYKSKHGTTQKVAYYLQEHLPGEVTLLHLDSHTGKISLKDFDTVIIGGSIYMGKIQERIKNFCQQYENELIEKNLGLFICCMSDKDGQKAFEAAFSENLRQHAKASGIMGGELLLDKMNFMEKLIIRMVSGTKESVSKIDYDAIDKFANEFTPA